MRGYVALVSLLAAIWGASFMFIKIAVDAGNEHIVLSHDETEAFSKALAPVVDRWASERSAQGIDAAGLQPEELLGVDDLAATTLFSDGTTIYHCHTSDEIIDPLAADQGVFGVAVPGLITDLTATITTLPTHNAPTNTAADTPDGGEVDLAAATRSA